MWLSGCHRDADLTTRFFIRFLESKIRDHAGHEAAQVTYINLRIGAEEHTGKSARFPLSFKVYIRRTIEMFQFLFGVGTDYTGNQRTCAGTGDHPWQQALFQQGFDHAQVIKTQHTTTTEHQRRAAITDIGTVEKIQFFLGRYQAVVQLRQVAQRVFNLVYVLFYQFLGAKLGLAIKTAAAHAAHIAVNALVECEHQPMVVVASA